MNASVVLWPGQPEWNLTGLTRVLQSQLKDRVTAAYLIGSYACGTADAESDIDLILVADTPIPWPDRGELFADLFDTFRNIDLFVYTPREWDLLGRDPTAFIDHASASWKKII